MPGRFIERASRSELIANCTCTEGHSHRQPHRALPLTYEQFRFANAVGEDEGKDLYATFAVPASGVPLFQARPPISIHGPKRRWIPRIPTGDRY